MHQKCKNVHIECILVDDCSPDSSISIVDELIHEYSGNVQFKIVRHNNNLGLSAARNTGIKHASGDYLFFLDSDDYITEDCMQILTDIVKSDPQIEVVRGNHIGRVKINFAKIPPTPINNDTILELFYLSLIPTMAWNTLIKKSIIKKWNISFQLGLLYEDVLWSVHLFRHTNSFLLVPSITYHYEANPESITGDQETPLQYKHFSHYIVIVDELLNIFDTKHFVPYTRFIVSFLIQMFDCIFKKGDDYNNYKHVLQLRNRLMIITLKHFRIILAIYELLLFMPVAKLIRYHFFRCHFYRIEKYTYIIAKTFDKLH